jgi:hypothetical protein
MCDELRKGDKKHSLLPVRPELKVWLPATRHVPREEASSSSRCAVAEDETMRLLRGMVAGPSGTTRHPVTELSNPQGAQETPSVDGPYSPALISHQQRSWYSRQYLVFRCLVCCLVVPDSRAVRQPRPTPSRSLCLFDFELLLRWFVWASLSGATGGREEN